MSTAVEETTDIAKSTTNKWVYLFEEGSGDDKSLLGGKGAGPAERSAPAFPCPRDSWSRPKLVTHFSITTRISPMACGTRLRKVCRRLRRRSARNSATLKILCSFLSVPGLPFRCRE